MDIKAGLYACSLTVKSIIIFVLPFIIFGLLYKVSVNLAGKATKIVFFVLIGICISNFIASIISGYIGTLVYNFDMVIEHPGDLKSLEPLFNLVIPKLIANDKAMCTGLLLGILSSICKPVLATKIALYFDKIIKKILYLFNFLIPIFVAGFVVKLQYDGVMLKIIENYLVILSVIAISVFSYLALGHFVASNFNFNKLVVNLKNMLPACIVGFSTMSSAAAMPLMIEGVEKNSSNPELAKSIIPLVVNFHLLGCFFSIPIFAYAILKNYGMAEPSYLNYLMFCLYFVVAKFSVAAVPGGGIIVMLPILEALLGFNSEMLSLITALYILFDPVITCANILGNGCFAMLVSKISIYNKKSGS